MNELFECIPWTSYMLSANRAKTVIKERIKHYERIKVIKDGLYTLIYINMHIFIFVYIHIYEYKNKGNNLHKGNSLKYFKS